MWWCFFFPCSGLFCVLHTLSEHHARNGVLVSGWGQILQQHQLWVKRLPQVHPHYAVKCNPSPAVLRTLASLGCSFDCASKTEIQQVLALPSVHAEDIIFANPCKLRSHLVYAREVGVKRMTFDSELELHKVCGAAQGGTCVEHS